MKSSFNKKYRNINLAKSDGYGVVCVCRKDTGLPYDILLFSHAENEHPRECPRVGVIMGRIVVPVSISKNPKVLSEHHFEKQEKITEWIAKHRKVLLKHWRIELSDREILEILSDKGGAF